VLFQSPAHLWLFLRLQLRLKVREGIEGRCRHRVAAVCAPERVFEFGVFVLVAVGAKQLPVAAIGGVVVVIAVFVMDFEQLEIGMREGARAAAADPRIHFQRAFAIAGGALVGVAAGVADELVEFVGGRGHGGSFGHGRCCVKRGGGLLTPHPCLPPQGGKGEINAAVNDAGCESA